MSCWNVRTLVDSAGGPERRTAIVAKELGRYNIDIAALSETHLLDDGQVKEIGGGYTIFWKGKPSGEKREEGVGFAIKSDLVSKLNELPRGITERLMTLRLHLSNGRFATLISAYAPTMDSTEEKKSAFYESLKEVIANIPISDKVVLLGDFNARVGTDWETWNCLGHHGIGKVNENGLRLLQLCTELNLFISSTQFKHKGDHVATWMHPRSKQWHLIDYMIVRSRDKSDVHKVSPLRGADCWSDHALVRGKFQFSIHPKCRQSNTSSLPRQLDVSKLKNHDIKTTLQQNISSIEHTSSWDDIRDQLLDISKETLGFKKAQHRDWFDESDPEISQLLSQKNALRQALLQTNLGPEKQKEIRSQLKRTKAETQSRIRQMKDQWWSKLAADIQSAADMNNSKELYSLTKQAYGPKVAKNRPSQI